MPASSRRFAAFVAASLGTLAIAALAPAAGAQPGGPPGDAKVIVLADAEGYDRAQRAVEDLGGRVTRDLPLVHGFAAVVPLAHVEDLAGADGVASVSEDAAVRPLSIDPALGYDAADTGSLSSIATITGAQAMWNAGYTGKGVDVAVIDTGVTRVPGLDAAGKVIDGPDLSFDSQNAALTNRDGYGHGTHMASIIAGSDVAPGTSARGCTTCLTKSAYSDTRKFVGIAPESRIVNVKVGAADGATDVSQVIAGIDWVVQHRKDPGFNIRVLNLSFGTTSSQDWRVDPLSFAAEAAWRNGIVVVVAAGNDGLLAPALANPAYNPNVLAVGADDPNGTVATSDDYVPLFASHGTVQRPVDVIAPGVSVLGLRVPGGYIDSTVATGKTGTRFQRGSGTSQAAAVVSGLAALFLQRVPAAGPDTVKSFLKTNALPLPLVGDSDLAGVGTLNQLYSGSGIADVTVASRKTVLLPAAAARTAGGTGGGSLEQARGGVHVESNGVALTGEIDIFGRTFSAKTAASLELSGSSWVGGIWNGNRWTGDSWNGNRWTGSRWTGNDWAGGSWLGNRWTGMTWDGNRWTGGTWSGSSWRGSSWRDAQWSGSSWR